MCKKQSCINCGRKILANFEQNLNTMLVQKIFPFKWLYAGVKPTAENQESLMRTLWNSFHFWRCQFYPWVNKSKSTQILCACRFAQVFSQNRVNSYLRLPRQKISFLIWMAKVYAAEIYPIIFHVLLFCQEMKQ